MVFPTPKLRGTGNKMFFRKISDFLREDMIHRGGFKFRGRGCPKKVENRAFCGLFSKIIIDFGKSWIKCWEMGLIFQKSGKKPENQVKKYKFLALRAGISEGQSI